MYPGLRSRLHDDFGNPHSHRERRDRNQVRQHLELFLFFQLKHARGSVLEEQESDMLILLCTSTLDKGFLATVRSIQWQAFWKDSNKSIWNCLRISLSSWLLWVFPHIFWDTKKIWSKHGIPYPGRSRAASQRSFSKAKYSNFKNRDTIGSYAVVPQTSRLKPQNLCPIHLPRLMNLHVSWQPQQIDDHSTRLIQISQHLILNSSSPWLER